MNSKSALIEFGKRLVADDLTKGTGGNLSYFDRKKEVMYITPTGIPFDEIIEEDIVGMSIDGSIVEGSKAPSSEWNMHLIFYRERTDLNAIIHAHTTYSTAVACLRGTLPAVHYMLATAGLDVRCAEYATFGTQELAENAFEAMTNRKASLLANHGVLAGGRDLPDAFNVLEELEYCSKLYYLASTMGTPVIIRDDELENNAVKFKTYGQASER